MNLCPTASEAEKSRLPIDSPERSDHDLPSLQVETQHPLRRMGECCEVVVKSRCQPTYTPTQKIVEATGTLFFKFGDLDSTKPAGGIKIRIETIVHYLSKYSQKIIQQKLEWLSPNCPLGTLPPFAPPQAIQEEACVAQQLSSSAS